MHNGPSVPLSHRMPVAQLNNNSYATDKEKSFSDKSGLNEHILDDFVSIDIPERYNSRYQRHYADPPPSNSKNCQSASKEPVEYIFAENYSSIYYTENLGDQSNRQFDSQSYKQYQSGDEEKEYVTEYKKSLSSLNQSQRESKNPSLMNISAKDKTEDSDAFEDRSLCILEKDSLSNGVIIDPIRVNEEKPFIVVSVPNDIQRQKRRGQEGDIATYTTINSSMGSISKNGEDSIIFARCQEEIKQSEMQIMGLKNLQNQVSDFVNNLSKQRNELGNNEEEKKETPKLQTSRSQNEVLYSEEDMDQYIEEEEAAGVEFVENNEIMTMRRTADDPEFLKKKEELARMNMQLLEEDTNVINVSEEDVQHHPFMKKTLSVIFSTNESIETNSYAASVKRLETQAGIKEGDHLLHSQIRTNSRTLITQESDTLKNKELNPISGERVGFMMETVSSVNGNEDENFMSLAQMMKFQMKDNKDFSEKLCRLIDLYYKQIEKYEINNSLLLEKNKKYSKGNELLIKTLKAFEKEMDALAANNKTLHKNILFLQEEVKSREAREKDLKDICSQQEDLINKLKEELNLKLTETDDLKRKLALSNAKIESLSISTQNCEESIFLVNQVLKEALTQKKSKITSKSLYTALETIYAAISKFVDYLEPKFKIEDSQSTSIGSRKGSDITKFDDSMGFNEHDLLSTRRDAPRTYRPKTIQQAKPIKHVSKSIDFSTGIKGGGSYVLLSQRAVTNRHRQHSLADSGVLSKEEKENSARELSARGRMRQTSIERAKYRIDKSAPARENQINSKNLGRTNKYALEAGVEENLRKRLMHNLKVKNSKQK